MEFQVQKIKYVLVEGTFVVRSMICKSAEWMCVGVKRSTS